MSIVDNLDILHHLDHSDWSNHFDNPDWSVINQEYKYRIRIVYLVLFQEIFYIKSSSLADHVFHVGTENDEEH